MGTYFSIYDSEAAAGPVGTVGFLAPLWLLGLSGKVYIPQLTLRVDAPGSTAWLVEGTTGLTLTLGAPGTMRLTLEAVPATRIAADGS